MIKIEHNVETGEVKEVEMTAEEVAIFETEMQKIETVNAAYAQVEEQARLDAETKTAARIEVLAKLGLTAEEAALLLGGN